jgi:hypothetical protein
MIRVRSLVTLGMAAFAGMAGVADLSLRAASSPSPTVSITRITALNSAVWPGDFNGDGITDLVGTAANVQGDLGGVAVALGKGDGTFKTPFVTGGGLTDRVLAVGDFNKDGKLDLVTHDSGSGVEVLAGTGDGNFNTDYPVSTSLSDLTNALVGDLNGDGNLDIVAVTDGTAYIFPGHGDFTFGTPATLTTGILPLDGVIADLNGDGRADIVLANHEARSISVFLNHGALTFTASDMPLDLDANDVVARDLNGDGKMDLVVAVSETHPSAGPDFSTQGFAYVLLGHGDGTFAPPVKYETAPGAWQIVLGDFTRDGILDIATANRSSVYRDDCGISLKNWDSVSILPGTGAGTFGTASSFSLGDQSKLTNERFKNTVVSLNTSDLNGDHATDLIASWGGVLINKPSDPNWAPSVAASSTQPDASDHSVTISAVANDSDQDMLLYSWTDSGGSPLPPVSTSCLTPITFGVHTFTVTVDDQHGHTASSSVTVDFGGGTGTPPSVAITAPTGAEVVPAGTPYTIRWTATAGSAPITRFDVELSTDDGAHYGFVPGCANLPASARSCQWNDPDPPTETARVFILAGSTNGPSGSATTDRFSIRSTAGGGGGLPSGWAQADIGAVGAAGSASVTNGVWTVKGSGADIWGTADEFHYAWMPSSGPENWFEITARVTNVENVDRWTKVGLMVRSSQEANAPQASIFVTPTSEKGIVFQRRQFAGSTSLSEAGPSITAPVWLKLILAPTAVRAYYRTGTTGPWTFVGQDEIRLSGTMLVGLAVTSHKDGTLATGTFDNVSIRPLASWSDRDIGSVGVAGSGRDDCTVQTEPPCGAVVTLQGSGADIWGTADAFHLRGNDIAHHGIAARVLSVSNTNAWTKAGVMIRDSFAAGAPQVMVVVSPSKGVAMQYRATASGISSTITVAGVAPKWVRLGRTGSTFVGEWSDDGLSWTEIGRVNVTMQELAAGGLVLTSHDNARLATATFDDIYMFRP